MCDLNSVLAKSQVWCTRLNKVLYLSHWMPETRLEVGQCILQIQTNKSNLDFTLEIDIDHGHFLPSSPSSMAAGVLAHCAKSSGEIFVSWGTWPCVPPLTWCKFFIFSYMCLKYLFINVQNIFSYVDTFSPFTHHPFSQNQCIGAPQTMHPANHPASEGRVVATMPTKAVEIEDDATLDETYSAVSRASGYPSSSILLLWITPT